MLNNAVVLWMAACQKIVAQSTAEAEYYSLGTAAQDVIFMRELLHHLGLPQDEATVIYEDNQACISIASNPLTSKKARHIMTKYHLVRQLIEENTIELKYTPTEDMLADIFTKALNPTQHIKFTRLIMNIKD